MGICFTIGMMAFNGSFVDTQLLNSTTNFILLEAFSSLKNIMYKYLMYINFNMSLHFYETGVKHLQGTAHKNIWPNPFV
jgi:hypothetical protein